MNPETRQQDRRHRYADAAQDRTRLQHTGSWVRWGLLALIVVHGLIHFMGFAKAFDLAEMTQLEQPISTGMGVVWLIAGVLMLATAAGWLGMVRGRWILGLGAVAVSEWVIVTSWSDAWVGTLANVVILGAVIHDAASNGPWGLRTEYRRDVSERLAEPVSAPIVTEADLAQLPHPVQEYLRTSGVVGRPRIEWFRARWRGRIRSAPDSPWMEFTAEQYNFVDEPLRLFFMDARRGGLPVDVLHVYRNGSASMRVRLASLLQLVDAAGPELDRAETVTFFNDLCLLAPAALIDPSITWEGIDDTSVRAQFTVGSETISATLLFNERGELIDFVSDDRYMMSEDDSSLTAQRWSTPVAGYREVGERRVFTTGEGRWHLPGGQFVYFEAELLELGENESR
jgi:hypothetical protein